MNDFVKVFTSQKLSSYPLGLFIDWSLLINLGVFKGVFSSDV